VYLAVIFTLGQRPAEDVLAGRS